MRDPSQKNRLQPPPSPAKSGMPADIFDRIAQLDHAINQALAQGNAPAALKIIEECREAISAATNKEVSPTRKKRLQDLSEHYRDSFTKMKRDIREGRRIEPSRRVAAPENVPTPKPWNDVVRNAANGSEVEQVRSALRPAISSYTPPSMAQPSYQEQPTYQAQPSFQQPSSPSSQPAAYQSPSMQQVSPAGHSTPPQRYSTPPAQPAHSYVHHTPPPQQPRMETVALTPPPTIDKYSQPPVAMTATPPRLSTSPFGSRRGRVPDRPFGVVDRQTSPQMVSSPSTQFASPISHYSSPPISSQQQPQQQQQYVAPIVQQPRAPIQTSYASAVSSPVEHQQPAASYSSTVSSPAQYQQPQQASYQQPIYQPQHPTPQQYQSPPPQQSYNQYQQPEPQYQQPSAPQYQQPPVAQYQKATAPQYQPSPAPQSQHSAPQYQPSQLSRQPELTVFSPKINIPMEYERDPEETVAHPVVTHRPAPEPAAVHRVSTPPSHTAQPEPQLHEQPVAQPEVDLFADMPELKALLAKDPKEVAMRKNVIKESASLVPQATTLAQKGFLLKAYKLFEYCHRLLAAAIKMERDEERLDVLYDADADYRKAMLDLDRLMKQHGPVQSVDIKPESPRAAAAQELGAPRRRQVAPEPEEEDAHSGSDAEHSDAQSTSSVSNELLACFKCAKMVAPVKSHSMPKWIACCCQAKLTCPDCDEPLDPGSKVLDDSQSVGSNGDHDDGASVHSETEDDNQTIRTDTNASSTAYRTKPTCHVCGVMVTPVIVNSAPEWVALLCPCFNKSTFECPKCHNPVDEEG